MATYATSALLAAINPIIAAEDTDAATDSPATKEMAAVEASLVSGDLAPVAKIFNGTEYVPTKLSHKPEYFILYYTASW